MSMLPAIQSGGKLSAIVPQSMDEAYRMAKAVCIARMAPKGLDTPEACMIAIMHGMELGLAPLTALQRIAVVNGRPTIWGDGAMALVRGSGACEWVKETMTGDGDAMVATCQAMRRGEPEPIVRSFSVADAKRASLWGKSGPWSQFPKRMLQMRARAFALRDGFADVLGGLYLKEEIEDERLTPPRPPSVERLPTQMPESALLASPTEIIGIGEPAPDEEVIWDEPEETPAVNKTPDPLDASALFVEGAEAAERGLAVLKVFWTRIKSPGQAAVGGADQLAKWKAIAAEADAAAQALANA